MSHILFCLYTLLIRPLTLLFEFVFSVSYKLIPSPFPALLLFSLVVNIITLPLYNQADKLQSDAQSKEKEIRPMADHIKKCFSGDEKIMMLQTYYRYMDYSPITSLSSSISLLLQIPFFIAAYQVLSSSIALKNVSWGPISDLGSADSIMHIGDLSINILPILMTLINIISSTIYSKSLDKKAKIQLYVTALVFLVLLYNSPSGLVLYWTLNNVFSLVKNIVMKLVPTAKMAGVEKTYKKDKKDTIIFILYALSISVIVGILIPSDLFVRSVGDFLINCQTINLTRYLWISLCISLGIFLLWGGIYFYISKNRIIATVIMVSLSFVVLFDYFAFFQKTGDLNRYLYNIEGYEKTANPALNMITIVLIIMLVVIIIKNKKMIFCYIGILLLATLIVVSSINTARIYNDIDNYSYTTNQRDYPMVTLSKNGNNVVIIMLDRAVGRLIPYIMNERPELEDRFDGFTYYRNSLSLGTITIAGSPSLFGGYDYTPTAMNERNNELLSDKHNEALCVLPVLFGENGYNVTLMDPPFADYKIIPNLSVFDNYPYIDSYISTGITNPYINDMIDDWSTFMERNLFSDSLRQASPVFLRNILYDDGFFNDLTRRLSNESYFQSTSDISHANGIDFNFINEYSSLNSLSDITNIDSTNTTPGSLVILTNNTTHQPTLLTEPDYSVSSIVDNTSYDSENSNRFTLDGITINITEPVQMGQYHSQIAALESLANWFDYLREQGIYDNTRIIIVSDHGDSHLSFGDAFIGDFNLCRLNCLMMVKDFNETGFTVSDSFIVNSEVPYIATNGLIDNPINPFTGNPITSQIDHANNFRYFVYECPNPSDNLGYTYNPGYWYSYDTSSEDIFDTNSWNYIVTE